jgi:hypothetical protein
MKKPYLIAMILLAFLTLVSLALNGVAIVNLPRIQQIALEAQRAAQAAIADARQIVAGVGDDTFSYTFEIQQEIPIAASVPFNEDIAVPIRATIPISTIVIIPINAGLLGTFDIDVPIRTMIPIDLNVTIPVSHTVDIVTTVPLNMALPVKIPLAETPLIGYLEELDAGLAQMEEALTQIGSPAEP